jgi:aminopeptidase N
MAGSQRSLGLLIARHSDADADLTACESDLKAWIAYLSTRYQPWVHGDTFTAVIWGSPRGMEYDGATTSSTAALEHEVFHSWFGRGVKPARAADGWIDEAWTTWSTASRRSEVPRFGAMELGLDEDPVELYPPHPWSRHTPVEAYSGGARLFAGLAHVLGGADRLRAAMGEWYLANAGGLVTTDGLGAHLQAWSGVDISPWWARYVHGRG